jgi:hypothetical protein
MLVQKLNKTRHFWVLVAILIGFVGLQWSRTNWPLAHENVFERQAQTGGMIFLFCKLPDRTPLNTPQQHFGTNPFQMEFSLIEWLQAKVVRVATNGQCELYEPIVQKISLGFSVLAIVLIFFIGGHLGGPPLAVLIAAFFAYEKDWLKYSTYILTDPRTVFMVFAGVFMLLKGRDAGQSLNKFLYILLSVVAFFLAGGARPQAYLLWFGFFGALIVFYDCGLMPQWKGYQRQRSVPESILSLWPFLFGGVCALGYHMYASIYNAHRDLPWLIWAGPSIRKLYVSDFHERFEWVFYKSILLNWLHRTWLLIGLIAVSIPWIAYKNSTHLRIYVKKCILATLPFFIGQFLYQFTFLKVIKMHDYYAIPIGVISGLSKGVLIASVAQLATLVKEQRGDKIIGYLQWLGVASIVVFLISTGLRDYQTARQRIEPGTERFHNDLNPRQSIFPKEAEMVVIAHGAAWGSSPLSINQKAGFVWCAKNQAHAPREFWRQQRVQYVAWWLGDSSQETYYSDVALPRILQQNIKEIATDSVIYKNGYVVNGANKQAVTWLVRPIDAELAYARRRQFSSDIDDHWNAQSIFEWAYWASKLGYNVCDGIHGDPRRWDVLSGSTQP